MNEPVLIDLIDRYQLPTWQYRQTRDPAMACPRLWRGIAMARSLMAIRRRNGAKTFAAVVFGQMQTGCASNGVHAAAWMR